MLAVPFSTIGAVWLLWALDYNVSIAVWVGMIALMGLDAVHGAVKRVRPKAMTVLAAMLGLLPIIR